MAGRISLPAQIERSRPVRLIQLDDKGVTFRWKDYRASGKPLEFIRRFLLHVLPSGFQPHPPLRPARPPQSRRQV
jgi:hypothetical protein